MPSFRDLLASVAHAYREQREEVDDTANRVLAALARTADGVAQTPPGAHTVAEAARRLLENADRSHGGFGGAPKFPTPTSLDLLLAAADTLPAAEASDAVAHVAQTCHAMARGGIHDHLGGGFHRYSVDDHWAVPHFEKMLYDEGQLLRVYAETLRRTRDEGLRWPIFETVRFLRTEMRGPEGAFYASLDADSEGVEGKYYVWRPEEIAAVLGEDSAVAFCRAYGVTAAGNFEGTGATVLYQAEDAPHDRHANERALLLEARAGRIAPETDRKRVAGWNGLVISGLARAGSLLGDDAMIHDAATAARFVTEEMVGPDGRLRRVSDGVQARVPAFLDDMAAVLEGCLDLVRAGADEFLGTAVRLAEDIAARFFDPDEGDLFLTPNDGEPLVHRPRSDHDGATPHSAGWATLGLIRVAALTGRDDLARVATRVLQTHAFALERAPEAFPTLARAAFAAERGISVAVVVGSPSDPATGELAKVARARLCPEDAVVRVDPDAEAPPEVDPAWLAGRTRVDGRSTAYLCRGTVCSLPVHTPEALAALC
jgi:uncharacterized protein YyaL (SSP411 family)